MKKFSNNKASKGFYAALGISAVMIGSACWFAYDQGNKLSDKLAPDKTASETPVDREVATIPKSTIPAYTVPPSTKAAVLATTTRPIATIPAADIIVEHIQPTEDTTTEAAPVSTKKLENVKMPLADMGEIVGAFSGGELIKSPTTGTWQTHNGTDIKAEVGSEVYAVSSGEITEIKSDPVWGVTVELNHHNGFITRYCGLSQGLSVQEGDKLVGGDLIGTVGNTADIESALEPHLHIELLHNGSYVDPLSEIKVN